MYAFKSVYVLWKQRGLNKTSGRSNFRQSSRSRQRKSVLPRDAAWGSELANARDDMQKR